MDGEKHRRGLTNKVRCVISQFPSERRRGGIEGLSERITKMQKDRRQVGPEGNTVEVSFNVDLVNINRGRGGCACIVGQPWLSVEIMSGETG